MFSSAVKHLFKARATSQAQPGPASDRWDLRAAPARLARIACCTRIHRAGDGASIEVATERLERFVRHFEPIFPRLFVAIHAGDAELLDAARGIPRLTVVPVEEWSAHAVPLNALLNAAAADPFPFKWIGYFSVEVRTSTDAVFAVASQLDEDTLVVGAQLPGHRFAAGATLPLSGTTMPWNTFALWNMAKLRACSFFEVSKAPVPGMVGVEEAVVISTLQGRDPDGHRAKLVGARTMLGSLDTSSWGANRMKSHDEKLASKDTRAERQLDWLGLPAGEVDHVEL